MNSNNKQTALQLNTITKTDEQAAFIYFSNQDVDGNVTVCFQNTIYIKNLIMESSFQDRKMLGANVLL